MPPSPSFGLVLPNFGPWAHPRTFADLAALADASGWHGIFLTDTIQMQGTEGLPAVDPWISLAAMAMQTRDIRLGTIVSAPSRRRPWQLARELATLDHLSGGRLILGVGAGDPHDRAFSAFNETRTVRERAAILDETLELITRFWSGEQVRHDGQHFTVDDVALLPRPIQRPRIPIWVGWQWPAKKPLDRVARWDGAVPFAIEEDGTYSNPTPDELLEIQHLIAQRHASGTRPDIVSYAELLDTETHPNDVDALHQLVSAGATWLIHFVDPSVSLDTLHRGIESGPPVLPSDRSRVEGRVGQESSATG